MFDSQVLPPYPPARNAWEYPPPPLQKRWKWIAIAATLVSATVAGTLLTVAISLASDDYRGLIQDADLTDLIAAECQIMTSTVESMPVTGPPRRQAAILADQDKAVLTMIEHVRTEEAEAIRTDRPAAAWLHDWERLVDARKAYAGAILIGDSPPLRIPLDADGFEIEVRMNDVWSTQEACLVPDALLEPYGDDQSDV